MREVRDMRDHVASGDRRRQEARSLLRNVIDLFGSLEAEMSTKFAGTNAAAAVLVCIIIFFFSFP